jgi:hypothetical protein
MNLFDILLFPITAPVNGTVWVLQQIEKKARSELYDPQVLRAELLQLRVSYERNTISQAEYDEKSQVIWDRLKLLTSNEAEGDEDADSTD